MAAQYYWSLTQHKVVMAEEEKAANRIGPYASVEEAQNALKKVEQRNEEWSSDPVFNDPVDEVDDNDVEPPAKKPTEVTPEVWDAIKDH